MILIKMFFYEISKKMQFSRINLGFCEKNVKPINQGADTIFFFF